MTTIDTLVRDIMKSPYSKSYARERITEAKAEWELVARLDEAKNARKLTTGREPAAFDVAIVARIAQLNQAEEGCNATN